MKNIKRLIESLEKATGKKVILKEANEAELENAIKEWGILSDEIQKHEEAFKAMIAEKLQKEAVLKDKIMNTMIQLDLNTKKVDNLVAKYKAGYSREITAGYKELWETALQKVNANTRKVLEEIKENSKSISQVSHSFSVKKEGIMDTLTSVKDWLVNSFKGLWQSVKGMTSSVNELEALTSQTATLGEGKGLFGNSLNEGLGDAVNSIKTKIVGGTPSVLQKALTDSGIKLNTPIYGSTDITSLGNNIPVRMVLKSVDYKTGKFIGEFSHLQDNKWVLDNVIFDKDIKDMEKMFAEIVQASTLEDSQAKANNFIQLVQSLFRTNDLSYQVPAQSVVKN